MENNVSPLKTILEKAAYFSDEIEKLHKQVQDAHKEKNMLAKQEEKLNNDILSTAKAMHNFLYETISKMTGLYTLIQYELENEESTKAETTQQKKPLKNKKNLRQKTKKQVKADKELTKGDETQPKEPLKNRKNLRQKTKKEVKKQKKNINEKEVFLLDLQKPKNKVKILNKNLDKKEKEIFLFDL